MGAHLQLNAVSRRSFLRGVGGAASLAAFGGLIAACSSDGGAAIGGDGAARELELQLAWLPNAQSAGEWVAVDKGWYADAGIEVELANGGPEVNVMSLVGSGAVPVGISYQANTILARNQGVPVKGFAATLQRAPLTYFSLERYGVQSIADFAGKTVAVQPDGDPFLRAMLEANGLSLDDVNLERAGGSTAGLLEGQVDIIAGWNINIGQIAPLLEQDDLVTFTLYDNGLRQQSNIYVATDDTIASEQGLLAEILNVSSRGWEYAIDNPDEAIDIVKRASGVDLDPDNEIQGLEATAKLVFNQYTQQNGWGALNTEVWSEALTTFDEYDMLQAPLSVDEVITLDVLEAATDRVARG